MNTVEGDANTPIVKFADVSFTYPDGTMVLDGLSFEMQSGTQIALLGPSGSGKSTILHLIAGTKTPTSGSITLTDTVGTSRALMVQGDGLLPWYSIQKNFAVAMEIHGVPEQEFSERRQRWLKQFDIPHISPRFPSQLSGGQKQRASLARILALDASLLLLDEPLSAIDELQRERLQLQLRHLFSTSDLSSVTVTHSVEEAVLLSDRIFIIQENQSISKIIEIENEIKPEERVRSSIEFQRQCALIREVLK